MATNQSCGIDVTNDPWKQKLLQVLDQYGALTTKCNYDRQWELEQAFSTITPEYRFYACIVCRIVIPKQDIPISDNGFTKQGYKLKAGLDNGSIHLSTVLPKDTTVSCIYGKPGKLCVSPYIEFSNTNSSYIVQMLQALISDKTIKKIVESNGNLDLIRPNDDEIAYLHATVDKEYREDYTPPPQKITNGQCVLTSHGKKHFEELIKENKGKDKDKKARENEAKSCFPPKNWSSDNSCSFDEDCPSINVALCEAEPDEIKASGKRYKCQQSTEGPNTGTDTSDPQCYDCNKEGDASPNQSMPKKYCHQIKDGKWYFPSGCWGTKNECTAMCNDFKKYGPDGISPIPSGGTHPKHTMHTMHNKFREIIGKWLAVDLLLAIGSAYGTSSMLQRLGTRPPISQNSAISAITNQIQDASTNATVVNKVAKNPSPIPTKSLQPQPKPSPFPKARSEKTLWIAFGIFLAVSLAICIPIIVHAVRTKSIRKPTHFKRYQ